LGKSCTCACNGAHGTENCASAQSHGGFACADKLLAKTGLGRLRFSAWDDCAWNLVSGFATGLNYGLRQTACCIHVTSFVSVT
jgi:hypothetical protein